MTVTLLAFLVALLVGLAAYTRIETAVAGNTQRQAQARENALLALNVALGQLQKYAGPDRRATATAASFAGAPTEEGGTTAAANAQKVHYTGVWDSTTTDTVPLAWLASGIERGTPLDVTAAIPAPQRVELVGTRTAGTANNVVAALQDIAATGQPGARPGTSTVIGRYAWWVGDQGVKAPVAVPDTTASVTYAPFDSDDLRARLRQQLALGAGAANATTGEPIFEPRSTANTPLVRDDKVTALNQLAFLRNESNAALGPTPIRQNFHAWSPNNFAVLANTKTGGLRQDLSINPSLLGAAFAAWTDYTSYMERPENDPTSQATVFQIDPPYGKDPMRRRYRITAPGNNAEPGIAPVLSFFYLRFGVNKPSAAAPFTLSLRWAAALWNPYTSALVPEDLRLEVSGLPPTVDVIDAATNNKEATFPLAQLYGTPFVVTLPWNGPTASTDPDKQSWLPGRVYNWTFLPGAALTSQNPGRFNSADFEAFADGLQVMIPGSPTINSGSQLSLSIPDKVTLTVKLVRESDGATLATFTSPEYDDVPLTSPTPASNTPSQIGYLMRLKESLDNVAAPGTWLSTPGVDFRAPTVPATAFVAVPGGTDPAAYERVSHVYEADRLLNREKSTGTSYNEDVPIFELPRAPILSLGTAQHLALVGSRPFAIGNSWGVGAALNGVPLGELFDRFFFSGLTADVVPGTNAVGDLLLPAAALKLPRKSDGTRVTADDLRNAVEARSSRHLLQGAAFNLNSTSPAAWAAVLRGVRFPTDASAFGYLDADPATGTAADTRAHDAASSDARFFRFSQSAQETFKAEEGQAETGATTPSVANTHLFRRGMRTLTAAQVADLATKITDAIKARHAVSGPFRSLEEFLRPAATDAPSLLEQAIADARINIDANGNAIEFSSQFLTQADVLTALAPVLFARSDTFLIRTYGEVVNPATNAVEGRAWCEATVQRVPEYFDPADEPTVAPDALTSPLNAANGRRFKVVSFRWLTRSDI